MSVAVSQHEELYSRGMPRTAQNHPNFQHIRAFRPRRDAIAMRSTRFKFGKQPRLDPDDAVLG
jgi:hypothetical protein